MTPLHWRAIFSTTRTSFTTIGLGVSDTAGNATTALLDLATADVSSAPSGLPAEFSLAAPYPNPFNGLTTIDYDVPSPSEVRITLYDVLGRQVQTVLEAYRQPGRYRRAINSSTLPSGAYLCRLTASLGGGMPLFADTKRLLLVK